jgi:hypothetical protein
VAIPEIFDAVVGFVALAAVVATVLLLPLYLSQRRDVQRLRAWREREPEHPGGDIVASETLLDRAEAELAALAPEPVAEPDAGAAQATPTTAATRVTHERPALERITMERAALAPHRRWQGFVARATQPRILVAIGLVALVLGGAAIFASEELLSDEEGGGGPGGGAINRAAVTVAVFNGTSVNGLAGKVSSDVEASGYTLGPVTSTTPGFNRTAVLYADGQKAAAQKVARDLGVDARKIEPLDRETRRLAGDSDVVVIAGEDRAS